MVFHLNVTDEDYVAFNVYHLFHTKAYRPRLLAARCFRAICTVLVVLALLVAGAPILITLAVGAVMAVGSVIGFLRYPSSLAQTTAKNIDKLKKEGKLGYDPESTLELTEDEIISVTDRSRKVWKYDEIIRVGQDEERLFLMTGSLTALILPRRCLDGQDEALLSLLRKKCPQIRIETN
ncbi:MAG: YcxB family protein [Clostridia bacterium]|nr:YcxB family protein [Clostridia bacterium]